ncbi:MAG: hypothetical protein AAGH48_09280 [Pseudomonadota bacterium]
MRGFNHRYRKFAARTAASVVLLALLFSAELATRAHAQAAGDAELPRGMSVARMTEIISALDENMEAEGSSVRFTIEGTALILVYDEAAQRMRIMTPVADETALSPDQVKRLMQANFDSALDARYAIAQSLVWSIFLHPLDGLGEREFISGISQTANLARTFGTTFASSGTVFGGGDSQGLLERDLFETLEEKGVPI